MTHHGGGGGSICCDVIGTCVMPRPHSSAPSTSRPTPSRRTVVSECCRIFPPLLLLSPRLDFFSKVPRRAGRASEGAGHHGGRGDLCAIRCRILPEGTLTGPFSVCCCGVCVEYFHTLFSSEDRSMTLACLRQVQMYRRR